MFELKIWILAILCAGINSQEQGSLISKIGLICVPIKDCTYVTDLVKIQPMTTEITELILSLKCGTTAESTNVWCNDNNEAIEDEGINYRQSFFDNELCGFGSTSNRKKRRVGGGEDASFGEFPWMAILEYRNIKNELKQQCGGTLVNNKYVLTAAHCLVIPGASGSKLESVILGILDTEETVGEEERRKVDGYIVHPLYEATAKIKLHHHDIGLVRLMEAVEYTESIVPICLPNAKLEEETTSGGNEYIVAGWGITEKGYVSTSILQKLEVPYYDSARCTKTLEYTVMSTQMCAGGEPGKDSCKGDSGGPLMFKDSNNRLYQLGIISLSVGRGCGVGRPNIYTDLRKYIGWVYQNIKTNTTATDIMR